MSLTWICFRGFRSDPFNFQRKCVKKVRTLDSLWEGCLRFSVFTSPVPLHCFPHASCWDDSVIESIIHFAGNIFRSSILYHPTSNQKSHHPSTSFQRFSASNSSLEKGFARAEISFLISFEKVTKSELPVEQNALFLAFRLAACYERKVMRNDNLLCTEPFGPSLRS